ncbi:MAG: hypothetical protein KF799_05400 [Bdellovibrionales bacterium]|nr:hypothetical protein [Bdellovibrionales bacterium]
MSHEEQLKAALQRLETSVQKILSTRGYGKDAKQLKLLHEMIREQLTNANTRSATRTIR